MRKKHPRLSILHFRGGILAGKNAVFAGHLDWPAGCRRSQFGKCELLSRDFGRLTLGSFYSPLWRR
jgi:hypothetical protein